MTTVPKGANRPAATVRRTRAAQRTPLPGDSPTPATAQPASSKPAPKPAAKPAPDHSFGARVIKLRAEGKTWRQCAELLGVPWPDGGRLARAVRAANKGSQIVPGARTTKAAK